MANIQDVNVWYQGEQKSANVFTMYIIYDNLLDTANFRYQLIEEIIISPEEQSSKTLLMGELSINGADYELWDAEIDANAWIYNWAASKLNLTII